MYTKKKTHFIGSSKLFFTSFSLEKKTCIIFFFYRKISFNNVKYKIKYLYIIQKIGRTLCLQGAKVRIEKS